VAAQPPEIKLVCLARAPQFGRVKTRLAREIGELRALDVYHALLHANGRLLNACATELTVEVTVSGVWEEHEFRKYYGESILRTEQPKGDLGEKMHTLISDGLSEGYRGVILIGSDCPLLEQRHIHTAASVLRHNDIVIGPSDDGGYYLLGMRAEHPALFADMEWGRDNVLSKTLERLQQLKLSHHLLSPLYDIDTLADWKRFSLTT